MYNPDYHSYLDKIRNPRFQREAFEDQHGFESGTGERKPAVRRSKPSLLNIIENLLDSDREFITPRKYTPELIKEMISAYDGEIRFADEQVERVFHLLKTKGVYDDTVIIVMGDHGEILHEKKGYFGHHRHLYQGSLKIPLIMKFPGISPGRVDKPITNVDILPTLLDALGIENKMKMEGISYWPLMKNGSSIIIPEYQIFATYSGFQRQPGQKANKAVSALRKIKRVIRIRYFKIRRRIFHNRRWIMEAHFHKFAIVEGDWKLIRIKTSPNRKDVIYELYNLKDDPGENHDLSSEQKDVVKELKKTLNKYIKQKRKPIIPEQLRERTEEDKKEEIRTLKSLGYM
jgi:arylsulfatase A-like enzyme